MRRLLSSAATIAILATIMATAPSANAAPNSPDKDQPLASTSVVVNELSTRGPNGPLDEFIEVRNVSNNPVDLTGYSVRVYNGQNALIGTIALPAGLVLQPKDNVGQFLVLTAANFSGTVQDASNVLPYVLNSVEGIPTTGGVAVFGPTGARIDGVAYSLVVNAAREGQPALPETRADAQLAAATARDIVSTDTDNNRVDFSLHARTPGQLN
ncbi:lamin tail domain-containing protein [Actinosynnema sp. NPDC020468]|uniref:lamin tail domain-containing protein n=1 Tax=Actinosynnema sp. NPDC020468 TaxID=3154488 RepID=UPI003405655E